MAVLLEATSGALVLGAGPRAVISRTHCWAGPLKIALFSGPSSCAPNNVLDSQAGPRRTGSFLLRELPALEEGDPLAPDSCQESAPHLRGLRTGRLRGTWATRVGYTGEGTSRIGDGSRRSRRLAANSIVTEAWMSALLRAPVVLQRFCFPPVCVSGSPASREGAPSS